MSKLAIPAVCAVLALAGCHGKSAPPVPSGGARAPKARSAPPGPTLAEQTKGMVEAASQTASTVPVRLKFELSERPAVGQPLPIELAILPQIGVDAAAVAVADSTNLKVGAQDQAFSFAALAPDKAYRRTISVTPATDGLLQLDIAVTLRHDAIAEQRKFSVPIIVGGVAKVAPDAAASAAAIPPGDAAGASPGAPASAAP
ncbi:MAG TPA: hypothetical protein VMV25_03195 [Steroidobacteraceae bacterium]|nr:hypothetical protein [Steroidobacteraceae bacterium]